ncbi:MAG: hypothetical protein F6K04_01320 [Leptolyngbya sp. SIO4C5]|nr:hypothetical protein [Leptolyngbya sp. SIO4C5]
MLYRIWCACRDRLPSTLTGEALDRAIVQKVLAKTGDVDMAAHVVVCGLNSQRYPQSERQAYVERVVYATRDELQRQSGQRARQSRATELEL